MNSLMQNMPTTSPRHNEWTHEFMKQKPTATANATKVVVNKPLEKTWANEYLKEIPFVETSKDLLQIEGKISKNPIYSISGALNLGKSNKWTEEFSGNSTVKALDGKSLTEDFAEFTSDDFEQVFEQEKKKVESSYTQEFWKNLETEWKKEESDWLTEFEPHVPFDKYEFAGENSLKSHGNCFEEGKRKLAEGKLGSNYCNCN